jgi:hypothetical protein
VPDTGQAGYAKEVEMIIESILYDPEPRRRATQAILDSLMEGVLEDDVGAGVQSSTVLQGDALEVGE